MARKKRKAKPPKPDPRLGAESLRSALSVLTEPDCQQQLQIDFIRPGRAVIRKPVKAGWIKVAAGEWDLEALLELEAQGQLIILFQEQMGARVVLRPELNGAS